MVRLVSGIGGIGSKFDLDHLLMTSSQPSAAEPTTTTTRKVWQYSRAGSMPEILEQKTLPMLSAPAPAPAGAGAGGYLIRVAAVSINPTDYKNVDPSGPTFAIRMPVIPCSDFSGVVVGGPEDGLEVYGHIPTERTLLWHVSPTTMCPQYTIGHSQLTAVPPFSCCRVRALSRNTSSLLHRSYYPNPHI